MSNENQSKAVVPYEKGELCNKSAELSAIRKAEDGAADYVPHISPADIRQIVVVAGHQKRHGERNSLLIKLLFDGALRCSEAIGTRPCDLARDVNGWAISILGKGSKPGKVAISSSLAAEIQSYCYRFKIPETSRIFPISRSQCFASFVMPSTMLEFAVLPGKTTMLGLSTSFGTLERLSAYVKPGIQRLFRTSSDIRVHK